MDVKRRRETRMVTEGNDSYRSLLRGVRSSVAECVDHSSGWGDHQTIPYCG